MVGFKRVLVAATALTSVLAAPSHDRPPAHDNVSFKDEPHGVLRPHHRGSLLELMQNHTKEFDFALHVTHLQKACERGNCTKGQQTLVDVFNFFTNAVKRNGTSHGGHDNDIKPPGYQRPPGYQDRRRKEPRPYLTPDPELTAFLHLDTSAMGTLLRLKSLQKACAMRKCTKGERSIVSFFAMFLSGPMPMTTDLAHVDDEENYSPGYQSPPGYQSRSHMTPAGSEKQKSRDFLFYLQNVCDRANCTRNPWKSVNRALVNEHACATGNCAVVDRKVSEDFAVRFIAALKGDHSNMVTPNHTAILPPFPKSRDFLSCLESICLKTDCTRDPSGYVGRAFRLQYSCARGDCKDLSEQKFDEFGRQVLNLILGQHAGDKIFNDKDSTDTSGDKNKSMIADKTVRVKPDPTQPLPNPSWTPRWDTCRTRFWKAGCDLVATPPNVKLESRQLVAAGADDEVQFGGPEGEILKDGWKAAQWWAQRCATEYILAHIQFRKPEYQGFQEKLMCPMIANAFPQLLQHGNPFQGGFPVPAVPEQ